MAASYIKLILLMLGLLCFFYVSTQMAARRFGSRGRRVGQLEIIERLPLEPRRVLYLVRAGDRLLLVASSESGVRALTEFGLADLATREAPTEEKGV
jgi:flagellar biogenesis protein FliO